jgi:hypothetical protein
MLKKILEISPGLPEVNFIKVTLNLLVEAFRNLVTQFYASEVRQKLRAVCLY